MTDKKLPVGFMGHLEPLKHVDPKEVLERYLREESTIDIAKSLNVTRSGLNYWLLRVAETEWKDAQVLKALKRKEEAEDELDTATDTLTLARARERLKAAQWDLERVCKRIYGQDADNKGSSGISITINTVSQGRVIDAEQQSTEPGNPHLPTE